MLANSMKMKKMSGNLGPKMKGKDA